MENLKGMFPNIRFIYERYDPSKSDACFHVEQTPAEEVAVILEMQSGKYRAESIQHQWDKARADEYRLVKIPMVKVQTEDD
jgi:hypothetical protein